MHDFDTKTSGFQLKSSLFGGKAYITLVTSEGPIEATLRLGHVREDSGNLQDFYYSEMVEEINRLSPENRRQRALFREIRAEARHRRGLISAKLAAAEEAKEALKTTAVAV